jgi:SAM-dependent methyltransferase
VASSGDCLVVSNQAFYDDVWYAWRDMQRYAPAPRYLRRMVMRELSRLEFGSVLDVGCGEGTLLKMIGEAYPQVRLAGSELSQTALAYCREQLPRAHLFPLDIVRGDVPEHTYDLVVSVQVLEHLEDDLAALKQLKKMCARYVVISVPGGRLDEHGRRNGHYRHYTRAELVFKMEQAGFAVMRSFTCGWPIHSLFYRAMVRYLPQTAIQSVGLGAYDARKRMVMQLADWMYRLNLPWVGTEVFAVGHVQ